MTVIRLSITEFSQPNEKAGDIESTQQLSALAMELGAEIHKDIQKQRASEQKTYRPEVSLTQKTEIGENLFLEVSGRADGIWESEDNNIIIEEIKTTHNTKKLINDLRHDDEHPYLMQLRQYGWYYYQKHSKQPQLQLLIVNANNRKQTAFPVELDLDHINVWYEHKIKWVLATWQSEKEFLDIRKATASRLKFPFPTKRPGQEDLVNDVSNACSEGYHLLAQAPTGLGKTAGVLMPAIKTALAKGRKVFYVTPKNSQLREVENVLRRAQSKLKKRGKKTNLDVNSIPPLNGIILTSKAKICMRDEVQCDANICAFAKAHYDKVNSHQLIEKLRQLPLIDQHVLRDFAAQYEVCPYELGRQMMPWVDVIASDYHYALSPQNNLAELAVLPFKKDQKSILCIDEAHNLSDRALEWYSVGIHQVKIDHLGSQFHDLKKASQKLNQWFQKTTGTAARSTGIISKLDKDRLKTALIDFNKQMTAFLGEQSETAEKESELSESGETTTQQMMDEWFQWLTFGKLLEEPDELFFARTHVDETNSPITLNCVNSGPLTGMILAKYHAVVAFSATLKPFEYHRLMNGFDIKTCITKEYASPFPPSNRKIMIIPQVSTLYRERSQQCGRIADVITRISNIKAGNYFVFFPSFELLRQTKALLSDGPWEIVEQPNNATQAWVKSTLSSLKTRRDLLVLAVQGGVLSEGIDLPGEQIIGAFVVGPAIPMITPEREERRRRLQLKYGDGYAMAYIHPAMNKSVQAAGRVIRSPEDRGIIVMMDRRFLETPYCDALPADWTTGLTSPHDLVSHSILHHVEEFWQK